MSTCERKKIAESWVKAAKKYGLEVMIHVGATNLNSVKELVRILFSSEFNYFIYISTSYNHIDVWI